MSDKLMDFDEAVERFDPVLGLEVHVELGTATKMFDAAPNQFGATPNSLTTPTSVGLPGALPVVNAKGVEYAIRIGLALNCSIAESCRFARKNYFYPDLAKDFQTSQFDEPIAYDGYLDVELEDGEIFRVPIERAHMEEDAGKNTHIGGADGRIEGAGKRAPEVAAAYVRTLRDIFRAIGVSEARMERGNVRADVNVSLRESPDAPLGIRTETKNVNTFRSIEQHIRYEIQRQAAILADGGEIVQETRHGQADGTTAPGRVKSDADDYRYFPEPDLVPVAPSRQWVQEIAASLPEMPAAKRRRLKEAWGLSDEEMRDVVNAEALDLIEATALAGTSGQAARKWWMGELARYAKEQEQALTELPVTPAQIAALQKMVDDGELTDKLARQVLAGVLAGEGDPAEVAAKRGLKVVSDDGALLEAVDAALAAQPDVADKIRAGKVAAAGAIVGAVMKATRGQADAKRVRELIMERVQG